MALINIDKKEINDEIKELIKNPSTIKVLATKDKNGEVHAVFKGSIGINDEGNLYVYEIMESSQTQRNLTYALWFNKRVSVLLKGEDGTSYQIKGYPYYDHTCGPLFEETYKQLIERDEELDLAGIWEIIPDEIREETFKKRLKQERETLPILGHLDKDFISNDK